MNILIVTPPGMLPDYIKEVMGDEHDITFLYPGKDLRAQLKEYAHADKRPDCMTLISSDSVYSPSAGMDINEEVPLNPCGREALAILDMEEEVDMWEEATGVPVAVLRTAMTFGEGVSGPAAEMFSDVIHNRYIRVRGEEGQLSVVTALDVAKAVLLTIGKDDIYNVADNSNPTWCQLAEAMSANAGAEKRMATLPAKWADTAWRFCRAIPAVKASLNPEVRRRRSMTRTLNCDKLRSLGWEPFNTLEVLRRTAAGYPYRE